MNLKTFFTKKKIIWSVVLILLALGVWAIFFRNGSDGDIETAKATVQDIRKTVLTTGQVVSTTDLNLSFQSSGVVRRINVKEGDKVSAGQTLATLDQSSASASLETALASLAQAQANYEKVKAAATPEDIAVSQAAVDTAELSLQNAKQNLLNELRDAYHDANTEVLSSTNILFANPLSPNPQFGISGTVQTNTQAVNEVNASRVLVNNILTSWKVEIDSLNENNVDQVVTNSLKNLSTVSSYLGKVIDILTIYTQVTSGGSQATITTYQTSVGASKASVDASYNAVVSDSQAVKNAEFSLTQAKASLALKKAPARPEDINISYAQVLSAEGQVAVARTNLNNTVITAPVSGTITEVNIKLGEQATIGSPVIKLINVGELYTEADVSEADIASVEIGQKIDYTFDALGPDEHFEGTVLTINPASTVVSGVVNYKVTGSLDNIPRVKPGMTANMTILVEEKTEVLAIPSGAIINRDGKKFVRVINDAKAKTFDEVEVETGLQGDSGEIEILGGISLGQEVVTYIK